VRNLVRQHIFIIPLLTMCLIVGVVLAIAFLSECSAVGDHTSDFEVVTVDDDGRKPFGIASRLCALRNDEIDESSGLAVSRRGRDIYWTHNDSGGHPAVYAFDSKGTNLGRWMIDGATNRDWEDMASAKIDGHPILVVGEIGDNFKIWGTYRLYFVEEPEIKSGSDADTRGKLDLRRTLVFRYEDGNHNCEALALDSGRKEILLVTKTPGGGGEAGVYRMALPDLGFEASVDASDDTSTTQTADAPAPLPSIEPDESLRLDSGPEIETARKIATLKLPTVTAMDISACGCYAVVLTYGNAYYYERDEDETWAQAFARPPRMVPLPVRRQGESIGFGSDGKSLYLTSEKLPTPLWHLPPADSMD